MFFRIFITLFLCLFYFGFSAQNWHSLVSSYATNQNYGVSIDIHKSKQYFTGVYKDQLNIGFNSLYGISNDDIFFGKADLNGYTEWIKSINGKAIDRSNKIIALDDKLYISGIFSDSLFIGNDTLSSIYQKAAFLTYFDTLGNYINTFHPDAFNIEFEDFVINEDGCIILTGEFYQFFNHGSFSMNVLSGLNFFLIKYNPVLDSVIWGTFASGSSSIGRKVQLDKFGNIYVAGSYNNQTYFIDTLLSSTSGNHSLFVAKFDSNGNKIWVRTAEGDKEVHGNGITCDENGNTFIVGEFEGTVSLQGTNITSLGLFDILIAKYDTYGNLLWVDQAGGPESDEGYDIEIDANNDIIVLADASINSKYRSLNIGISGFDEPLLMKLRNSSGDLLWVKRLYSSEISGLVNALDITIEDSVIAITGINRSAILFNGDVIQAINNKDFYTAVLFDSLTYQLGFSELEYQNVSLYPNPCSDYFRIEGKITEDLTIFDLSGKEVLRINNYISNSLINISTLKNGLYLVKYKVSDVNYLNKILVNR